MKYGFMKVASAIPAVKVGDVIFNTQQIEDLIAQAEGKGVVSLRGKMIDAPIVARAKQVLEAAEAMKGGR